jgi:hypothetical protein
MKYSYDLSRKVETNHGSVEASKMNIPKDYFKKQWKNEEFRHSYLEEKVKLDIEYHLEELK